MITKKDIARQKAREIYSKELNKLVNETNHLIEKYVNEKMTKFYNKALRIAEKNVLAFEDICREDIK